MRVKELLSLGATFIELRSEPQTMTVQKEVVLL
jgi:hypothetical protein